MLNRGVRRKRTAHRASKFVCFSLVVAAYFQLERSSLVPSSTTEAFRRPCTPANSKVHYQIARLQVGILVQVGNWDLWDELAHTCIDHILHSVKTSFLMVSSHVPGKQSLVQKRYPCARVLTVPNYGADIAPFFTQLSNVQGDLEAVDFVLKLHTKTEPYWRKSMIEPICGTRAAVQRSLRALRADPTAGVVAAHKYVYFMDGNDENIIRHSISPSYNLNVSFYTLYEKISRESNFEPEFYEAWLSNTDLRGLDPVEIENHFKHHGRRERRIFSKAMLENLARSNYPQFVAGTIFWFRAAPVKKFLQKFKASTIAQSMSLETGYFRDNVTGRLTHAWERCFHLVLYSQGFKVIGIRDD